MKRVNWVGDERIIPNYGIATAGQTLTLPDKKADSFVRQGLAEYVDLEADVALTKHKTKKVAEDSNDG